MEINYQHMTAAVQDILESEPDWLANLSNISAIIKMYMADLNWSGFYLMKGGKLFAVLDLDSTRGAGVQILTVAG